jgi:cytochrome c2
MKIPTSKLIATCIASVFILPLVIKAAEPVVPGYERFYSDLQHPSVPGGLLLLGELNCISCHDPGAAVSTSIHVKTAPILDNVGSRVRSGFIRDFLSNPHQVKSGSTMPDMFANMVATEKQTVIDELTHYLASTGTMVDSPVKPDDVNKGRVLFNQIGCLACHDPQEATDGKTTTISGSIAFPTLSNKYTLNSLIEFLANPHTVRPAGRMPSLNLKGNEAREVASFLLRDLKLPDNLTFKHYEGSWTKLPEFSKLKPKLEGTVSGFDVLVGSKREQFGIVFTGKMVIQKAGEYTIWLGSDDGSRLLIDGKPLITVDEVHPHKVVSAKTNLSQGEHQLVVEYFEAGGHESLQVEIAGQGLKQQPMDVVLYTPKPVKQNNTDLAAVDPQKALRGATRFAALGCADCHQLKQGDQSLASTADFKMLAAFKGDGCISATGTLPNYQLSNRQQQDLKAAIAYLHSEPELENTGSERIDRTFIRMNCYTCHERNKKGGVLEQRQAFFLTDQKEMGDEARIPPPLSDTGSKLQPSWLKDLLANGTKVRPYMFTRMPKFGEANVGHLAAEFAQVDQAKPVTHQTDVFSDKLLKLTGRRLVGSKGFSCIKCHTFGNNKATGVQSLDMTQLTKRLQYDWFHKYVQDPVALRPLTRMPSAWPNGQVLLPQVLEGSMDQQIYSVWKYLDDGPKASIPQGIGQNLEELYVFDDAVIYRNFIEGAGPRAIGVGYPEKANLAFDANQMNIALLWHGSFIDAGKHWNGRGQGFQPPLGDNVLSFQQAPALALLESNDSKWPTGDIKKQGYRFLGYQLGDNRKPTFLYQLNKMRIFDFPNPEAGGGEFPALTRTLTVSSETAERNLFVRAVVAAKSLVINNDGTVTVDGQWTLTVTGNVGKPVIRDKELIVPVDLSNKDKLHVALIKILYQW